MEELALILTETQYQEAILMAKNGQHHGLYSELKYSNEMNYFEDGKSTNYISLIMKCRGSLLNLNGCCFRSNQNPNCSLCNLYVIEDIVHFIGVCPILNDIRKATFGKTTLTSGDIVMILNGPCFKQLYTFATQATSYRNFLNMNFNY